MAITEIKPEQLTFKAFELADLVSQLLATEAEKQETNSDFNDRIKVLKKSISRISAEIDESKIKRKT